MVLKRCYYSIFFIVTTVTVTLQPFDIYLSSTRPLSAMQISL